MIKAWVNDLNTTSFRITVSVLLAAVGVVALLAGILAFHWYPTVEQTKVLEGIGFVVMTMMGFDVLQFWGKRFSDAGYAAAKNPNQPVSVDVPPPNEPSKDATDGAKVDDRVAVHPALINPPKEASD